MRSCVWLLSFLLFASLSTRSLLKNSSVAFTTNAIAADTQITNGYDSNSFVGNNIIATNIPQTTQSVLQDTPKLQKMRSVSVSSGNCAIYAKSVTGIVTGAPVASQTMIYAQKAGYKTSKDTPEVGSIMQTKEGPVGHVAVVMKVEDGKVLTSERNYPVKSRWVPINDPVVVGFIYPKK